MGSGLFTLQTIQSVLQVVGLITLSLHSNTRVNRSGSGERPAHETPDPYLAPARACADPRHCSAEDSAPGQRRRSVLMRCPACRPARAGVRAASLVPRLPPVGRARGGTAAVRPEPRLNARRRLGPAQRRPCGWPVATVSGRACGEPRLLPRSDGGRPRQRAVQLVVAGPRGSGWLGLALSGSESRARLSRARVEHQSSVCGGGLDVRLLRLTRLLRPRPSRE